MQTECAEKVLLQFSVIVLYYSEGSANNEAMFHDDICRCQRRKSTREKKGAAMCFSIKGGGRAIFRVFNK